jgi:hypothetical protein
LPTRWRATARLRQQSPSTGPRAASPTERATPTWPPPRPSPRCTPTVTPRVRSAGPLSCGPRTSRRTSGSTP